MADPGSIPAGIMMVLMFTVPDIGATGQLVYATVTNILITAVFYTAMAIPYTSLLTVRTNSQEERATMGTFRSATGYIAGTIFAIGLIPITNAMGGTRAHGSSSDLLWVSWSSLRR